MCEDEQITPTSFGFRLCCWQVRAAGALASVQSQDVHSAAALRLFGFERVLEVGLSQAGRVAGRHARSLQDDRADQSSPLHNISKGGSTFARGDSRAAPIGLDDPHVGVAVRRIKRRVVLAALDGTGFESRHASSYYVRRRETGGKHRGKYHSLSYRRFPKAGILCDCASHIILAVVPGHGPKPDSLHYREALDEARQRVRLVTLAADAGYDSEGSHEYARYECGIRSLIPALIGRRTNKPPSGYWRRHMKARLHTTRYSQRWQVETVNPDYSR
jgi:hypothetical protein